MVRDEVQARAHFEERSAAAQPRVAREIEQRVIDDGLLRRVLVVAGRRGARRA